MDPSLFKVQVTSLNPAITDSDVCIINPQRPQCCDDFFRDTKVIGSLNPTGLGTTNVFEISKQSAAITNFYIHAVHQPVTLTAGTFVCYPDYTGFAEITQLRVMYQGEEIFKYGRDYMWARTRKYYTNEKRSHLDEAVFGNKTRAERISATINGFETFTPSCLPTSYVTSQATPNITLTQKLRIEIDTDTAANLLQTDGTYNPPIVTYELYVDFHHTMKKWGDKLVMKSKTENGIPYLINSKTLLQQYQVSAPNNNTPTTVNLLTNGVIKELMVWFVPLNLTNNPGSIDRWVIANAPVPVPPGMVPYQPIDHIEAVCDGVYMIRATWRERFMKTLVDMQYHSCQFGDNIYCWSASADPERENAALGNFAIAYANNPQLSIYWGPGGTGIINQQPQVLVLNVLYWYYTYVQFQGGNVIEVYK